ncbi:MAG: hypothetical protein MHM6MM_005509 [Cercozoa sp. M6MM]
MSLAPMSDDGASDEPRLPVTTFECAWHHQNEGAQPIFSIDAQPGLGKRILTGGGDARARIWCRTPEEENPEFVTQLCPFVGTIGAINVARFSPCGRLIALGGVCGSLTIWRHDLDEKRAAKSMTTPPFGQEEDWMPSAECWRRVATLEKRHSEEIVDLAWSPLQKGDEVDVLRLVSGGFDGRAFVWRLTLQGDSVLAALESELASTRDAVMGVAWDPIPDTSNSVSNTAGVANTARTTNETVQAVKATEASVKASSLETDESKTRASRDEVISLVEDDNATAENAESNVASDEANASEANEANEAKVNKASEAKVSNASEAKVKAKSSEAAEEASDGESEDEEEEEESEYEDEEEEFGFVTVLTAKAARSFRRNNAGKYTCRASTALLEKQSEAGAPVRRHQMYLPQEVTPHSRRPCWTADGQFLLLPGGVLACDDSDDRSFCVWVLQRDDLRHAAQCVAHLPYPAVGVRASPVVYTDMNSTFTLVALILKHAIVIVETREWTVLQAIDGIHYTPLTDAAWSGDGKQLLVSSTDGYVTCIETESLLPETAAVAGGVSSAECCAENDENDMRMRLRELKYANGNGDDLRDLRCTLPREERQRLRLEKRQKRARGELMTSDEAVAGRMHDGSDSDSDSEYISIVPVRKLPTQAASAAAVDGGAP